MVWPGAQDTRYGKVRKPKFQWTRQQLLMRECSPRELCQVWQDMLEEGIAPDIHLYHSVLSYLRKARSVCLFICLRIEGEQALIISICAMQSNHWEEFFSFFEEMRNRGLVPSGSVYNMAIHAAAKLALVERA